MAVKPIQTLKNLSKRFINISSLSDYITKLPHRPKPVLADFYTSNKESFASIVQGLNGKQTLLKVIELYKNLPEDEKEQLRKRHYDAYQIYQKDLNEIMMGIPPETQTKLILDGFIKNPDKLFNMNIPKIPQSAYSYFTQKHLKLEFNKSKKLPGKEILKEAAQKWRNLTKEEKLKCVEEWKTLKEEYVKNMENWKSNMQNNGYPEQLINLLSSRRGLYALLKSRKLQDTNKSKDPINDIEKKIENMEIDKISPLHTDKPRKKSKIEK